MAEAPSVDGSPGALTAARDAALRWLIESGIRTPRGGYHSVYRPETGDYTDWYGGETSLVCTAGAVLALDRAGYHELAVTSAEHICTLAISGAGRWRGALRAGRGSGHVVANYVHSAVLALLAVYERSRNERFLAVATGAGDFVMTRMQRRDGSIRQELCDQRLRRRRGRHADQTWFAHCIEGFMRLWAVTGDGRYRVAATRAMDWLVRVQRADGSFPLEAPGRIARLTGALRLRSAEDPSTHRTHPAIQTYGIKGLMMLDRRAEAQRTVRWLSRRVGMNGLLHQFYSAGGARSREEDVMPTAHFGLLMLEYPELQADAHLIAALASGVCSAQIADGGDLNASGAMRGLPLHATRGAHAYCWDTSFALLFLQSLIERAATPSPTA
jgi:hypothetical protein